MYQFWRRSSTVSKPTEPSINVLAVDAPRIVARFLRADGPPPVPPAVDTDVKTADRPTAVVDTVGASPQYPIWTTADGQLASQLVLDDAKQSRIGGTDAILSAKSVDAFVAVLAEVLYSLTDSERSDLITATLDGRAGDNDHFVDLMHRCRHAVDRACRPASGSASSSSSASSLSSSSSSASLAGAADQLVRIL